MGNKSGIASRWAECGRLRRRKKCWMMAEKENCFSLAISVSATIDSFSYMRRCIYYSRSHIRSRPFSFDWDILLLLSEILWYGNMLMSILLLISELIDSAHSSIINYMCRYIYKSWWENWYYMCRYIYILPAAASYLFVCCCLSLGMEKKRSLLQFECCLPGFSYWTFHCRALQLSCLC